MLVSWEQGWGGELACLATTSERRPIYDRQIRQDSPPHPIYYPLNAHNPDGTGWGQPPPLSSEAALPRHGVLLPGYCFVPQVTTPGPHSAVAH